MNGTISIVSETYCTCRASNGRVCHVKYPKLYAIQESVLFADYSKQIYCHLDTLSTSQWAVQGMMHVCKPVVLWDSLIFFMSLLVKLQYWRLEAYCGLCLWICDVQGHCKTVQNFKKHFANDSPIGLKKLLQCGRASDIARVSSSWWALSSWNLAPEHDPIASWKYRYPEAFKLLEGKGLGKSFLWRYVCTGIWHWWNLGGFKVFKAVCEKRKSRR